MIGIAKEMADRFIEFVLKFFKGESVEDQLTKALKVMVLTTSALLCVVFSLLTTNINLRMDLAEAEVGIAKINVLFDPSTGGPIAGFIRINDALTRQNNSFKNQNAVLAKQANKVSTENYLLRSHLLKVLEENKLLKSNNSTLLALCQKP